MIVWNGARIFGDMPGSLKKCIRTFWYSLYGGAGRPRPMIAVLEEPGVRDVFDVRATREAVDCLANHIAKECTAYHQVEIEPVHEMFCVVIFGLVGLMKVNPQIEDDVLMKVVEQTPASTWCRSRRGGVERSTSIHRQANRLHERFCLFAIWYLAPGYFR